MDVFEWEGNFRPTLRRNTVIFLEVLEKSELFIAAATKNSDLKL